MAARQDETWLFVAEWFDPMPQMKKLFVLKFFVDLQAVEMVDVKSKKLFLKKTKIPPEVSSADFFVGSKVNLFNRELEIVDYGDLKTKTKLQHQNQQTCILLSSQAYASWGKILHTLLQHNFNITKMSTFLASSNASNQQIGGILGIRGAQYGNLSAGVNLCICLHGENAFARLNDASSDITNEINKVHPRALNETLFACDSDAAVGAINSCIFGVSNSNSNSNSNIPTPTTSSRPQVSTNTATFDSCTCCIIKPHAFKSKDFGAIIDMVISQGYEISALKTVSFDRVQSSEFLEVYDGVIPDYQDHVIQLSNGMSVAMEVRCESAVETFRVTAGPWDVDMAKELYPESIRGTFGIDKPRSAIHCTDLSQDGQLECEYCFKIL